MSTIAGFYLLMLYVLFTVAKTGPRGIATLVVAFIFAWSIEATATCIDSYQYHFAYFYLPGYVPLYVVFGWVMVFHAGYRVSTLLSSNWLTVALLTGLLAVVLDLMFDPMTTASYLWRWEAEIKPWFEVPWSNFFGWWLLVCSLAGSTFIISKKFESEGQSLVNLFLEKTITILAAYAVFAAIFSVYQQVGDTALFKHSPLAQTLLHVLIFGASTAYVAVQFSTLPGGHPREWSCLLVPTYLIGIAFSYAISLSLSSDGVDSAVNFNVLIFLIPFLGAIVITAFNWPFRTVRSAHNS